MSEKFDVVIAGGAVMGSSTAYHLAADPGFSGRVLVIEKDMTYAKSATSLSLSSIRQQFSSPINIRVGLAGVAFLRELKQKLEVDGEQPDVPLTENGYLYLASEAGAHVLRENHLVQAREGADIALLSPEEIQARFPYLSVEGVALGALGLRGEGWFELLSVAPGVPPQGAQPRRDLSRGQGRRGRARGGAGDGSAARERRAHFLRRICQYRRSVGRRADRARPRRRNPRPLAQALRLRVRSQAALAGLSAR